MENVDYEVAFKKTYENLASILSTNENVEINYKDIIAKKFYQVVANRSVNKDGWEENTLMSATLIPEWSKGLGRISTEYAGINTDGTDEQENDDFESYYNEHPDQKKPSNKWLAPLKIQFDYEYYEYPLATESDKQEIKNYESKALNYHDALDVFIQIKKVHQHLIDMIVKKTLLVKYMLVKKQTDPEKAKIHPYWIYPKPYKGRLDVSHKDELQAGAFIIKAREYKKIPQELAAVIGVYPARLDDFYKTDQLDLGIKQFVSLNKEQKKALTNFKWRYRKSREKTKIKQKERENNDKV